MAMRKSLGRYMYGRVLPHIWSRGSWSALGVAVIAAVLLSAVMVGSFGWSELIAPGVRNTLWVSLAIVWCMRGNSFRREIAAASAAKDEAGRVRRSFRPSD